MSSPTMERESSPLLRLPPELRNRIYKLALPSERFEISAKSDEQGLRLVIPKPFKPRAILLWKKTHIQPLALTATCKTLRAEATKLFYATNRFVFNEEYGSGTAPEYLARFKDMIGPTMANALRCVELTVESLSFTGKQAALEVAHLDSCLDHAAASAASIPLCHITFRFFLVYDSYYGEVWLEMGELKHSWERAFARLERSSNWSIRDDLLKLLRDIRSRF